MSLCWRFLVGWEIRHNVEREEYMNLILPGFPLTNFDLG